MEAILNSMILFFKFHHRIKSGMVHVNAEYDDDKDIR